MANTTVGFDGKSPPRVAPAVGSMTVMAPFKTTVSGTTTSETITFPNLTTIQGWIVQVIDTNNDVATSDADITASGNVLTIADGGSTFNLDASGHTIYGIVWGTAKV